MPDRPSKTITIGIAFASFILLGLPIGFLGVAWPTMQHEFGVPLDALGTLLIASTVGYAITSFASGQLISRFGLIKILPASALVFCLGLLGQAFSPTWTAMIFSVLCMGVGTGGIDSLLNGYLAARYGATTLNWLQAFYGLGATLGPILMTVILQTGKSWRSGIVLLAVFQGILAISLFITRKQWGDQKLSDEDITVEKVEHVSILTTLKMPIVWATIGLYFLFAGVESTSGQWTFTLFTQARAIDTTLAGIWVSVYWASMTVGRIGLGVIVDRFGVIRVSRVCVIGVILGAALLWWNPINLVGFLGLAIIGFAEAPLYASVIAYTPKLLGSKHAPNAIGLQIGIAGLGYALIPAFVGYLAGKTTLEIISPFILITAIIMFVLLRTIANPSSKIDLRGLRG